jgi:serine/threonine protein kinase
MIRLLGQSDTGYTYRAVASDDSQVVVKELCFASAPSEQDVEAFEREARLLQRLRHPRIPRYRDSFREGEGPGLRLYLAYDFVMGTSLLDELKTRRYTEEDAFTLAQRILEILRYLHELSPQVIHRDIKPQNLIRRPNGSVVLVDFGAARELAHGTTASATVVGTFGYMPLEQLGGIVDETSDLYALGATLVHLLALKPPWELLVPGRGIVLEGAVPVSPAFRKFLERLLAPRGERFPSAAAALAALEGRRFLPRGEGRPWGLAAGALLLLVLGFFIAKRSPEAPPQAAAPSPVAVPRPKPSTPPAPPKPPPVTEVAEPKVLSPGAGVPEAASLSLISPDAKRRFPPTTVLASGQRVPNRLVVHQGFAYWSTRDGGEVMRVSVNGGTPEPIATGVEVPWLLPLGGPRASHLYWLQGAMFNPRRVFRWPLAGGTPKEVFSGQSLELMTVSGDTFIYLDRTDGKLKARKQGAPPRVLLASAKDLGELIVAPPWIYLSNVNERLVFRMRLDGSQQQVVKRGEGTRVFAFAVNSQYVFWSDADSDSIFRVPRAGGRVTQVAKEISASSLAADARFLYMGTSSEVSRVPISGGEPEVLTPGRHQAGALTVDEEALYWSDRNEGSVMRMAKP